MEKVDLKKLAAGTLAERSSRDDAFAMGVVASSGNLAVVTWTLGPHRRMPEMVFPRSEAAYLVLEGSLSIMVDEETHALEAGELLSIGKHVRHRSENAGDVWVRVLLMRGPGPVRFEDLGVGRIECPVCASLVALEKGDRANDRVVCGDCSYVMTLEENEGLLRPATFMPEPSDGPAGES